MFGETKHLKSLANIPLMLKHGLVKDGEIIEISSDKKIVKILDKHLEGLFEYLLDNQYNIEDYDKVIWTGGVAPLHAERLLAMNNKNFVVLNDEGQQANVLGLWNVVKAINKKGGVVDGVEETANAD